MRALSLAVGLLVLACSPSRQETARVSCDCAKLDYEPGSNAFLECLKLRGGHRMPAVYLEPDWEGARTEAIICRPLLRAVPATGR